MSDKHLGCYSRLLALVRESRFAKITNTKTHGTARCSQPHTGVAQSRRRQEGRVAAAWLKGTRVANAEGPAKSTQSRMPGALVQLFLWARKNTTTTYIFGVGPLASRAQCGSPARNPPGPGLRDAPACIEILPHSRKTSLRDVCWSNFFKLD
jgi:hypothetical protein